MSDDWQRCLIPHLSYVIENLQPTSLLDKLKEKRLVSDEEYAKLHKVRKQDSNQECNRQLLDILPKKGQSAFRKFVDFLRNTPGQEHIADKLKTMDTTDSSFEGKTILLNQLVCALSICTCTHAHSAYIHA